LDNNTVINVTNIGKKYRIGERGRAYKTARDSIVSSIKRLGNLRSYSSTKSTEQNEFWALEDISFDVKQGEVVGIIGHNGAGKSTLLKILSRITEPTKGTADIYGRVGSLLEVGTGFHHELTGRENIYLSGAILGMKKKDIDSRFDEMVTFAGVEKFIDTPIKHYSSGMSLRLGFSVAAHMEPDILLVDEVLAVGDLEFQKKCLNKMENVANEGRTVLFVSHNMASIKELCQTAIVLKNGKIDYQGGVVKAIQHYSRNILNIGFEKDIKVSRNGWINIFINDNKEDCRVFNTESFQATADLALNHDIDNVVLHCFMENSEGNQVVHNRQFEFEHFSKGIHRLTAEIPPLYLKPGVYTLFFKLLGESSVNKQERYISERLVLDVSDKTNLFSGKVYATILPPVKWSVSKLESNKKAFA
jgi:lipopolysaccharide transport system ATP-binding protein